MSNSITFTNTKLWKNEHEGRKGTWYTFSVSVSKKMQDGSYKNKGMRVFSKEPIPNEVPNGTLVDIDGFLTLDAYEGRNGEVTNIALFATNIDYKDWEGELSDPTEEYGDYGTVEEGVPF